MVSPENELHAFSIPKAVLLLILPPDFFFLQHRICDYFHAIQILAMHIHCGNLVIGVGRVVVNTFLCIPTGRIDRNLILILCDFAASALLIYGT